VPGMAFAIDESTEFGARAARHLREDKVVWLTTVTPAGAPVPSPVWFWWEEPGAVLMFSRAGTPRTRNLAANPHVSLNFPGNGQGGDIVVLSGSAAMDDSLGPASEHPEYVEKYAEGIARVSGTPEEFSQHYPVTVRIELTRVRGH
jgi:PPOX class probable F420-dependent enzyme